MSQDMQVHFPGNRHAVVAVVFLTAPCSGLISFTLVDTDAVFTVIGDDVLYFEV